MASWVAADAVVDDNPEVLACAAGVGTRTVLVSSADEGEQAKGFSWTINSLSELPAIIERLT